ncbi:MAG: hypothetical protein CBC01_00115 [Betaproteobacteria bacterium TMED41]|nr:MAG: hypothetical protein CBC01_00115 [Betaproteobacteria bacterium TMED41]
MFDQKKFYKNNLNKFVVNYPQERLDGELYKYCCAHCKVGTLEIRGKIENHLDNCEFRINFLKTLKESNSNNL